MTNDFTAIISVSRFRKPEFKDILWSDSMRGSGV